MAKDTSDPRNSKKPVRRLRATPTFREQTEKQQTHKPKRLKKIFSPVKATGRGAGKLGRAVGTSGTGKTVAKVYKSKPFAPVRLVVKLLSKLLFVSYFVGAWEEIRKVTWPDRGTTWRLTFAVILFGVVFGAVVAGVDWVFERIFREVILRA